MRFSLFTVLFLLTVNIFPQTNENIFQRNAINYDSDYFHINDEFILLGNIDVNRKNIILANNVHSWGASTQRATWRFLLFLNDGTFLGMYTGITFNTNEIRIEQQRVYFSFEAKTGNVIDFSKGIPNKIWIDGHIIPYIKVNDL
jgi:hypothetical protein